MEGKIGKGEIKQVQVKTASRPIYLQIPEFSCSYSLKPGEDGSLYITSLPGVATSN